MYDQIREDHFFILLYGGVTAMALMACCYLLLRDGNAFAADITPPVRLRRWVAAFFASIALNHAWYLPVFFFSSSEDISLCDLVGGLLDCMTFFPLAIVVLLVMLQDRKRPLWPVAAMMVPIVAGGVYGVAARSYALLPMIYVYFLLMCMGLIIYIVRATRQYGRWLRDNFADLEHKEVWQSLVVLAVILLLFAIYVLTSKGPVYQYAMQVIYVILICYLLWRVETLSDLSIAANYREDDAAATEKVEDNTSSLSIGNRPALPPGLAKNMESLLKQYCEESRLYLQYDISLSRLAMEIGTNRYYLSQYFSCQGMNYNAYINKLRVNHFVSLYREAAAAQRSFTAQQLAQESGYRSYHTFREAFKRQKGLSVTAWIKEQSLQSD